MRDPKKIRFKSIRTLMRYLRLGLTHPPLEFFDTNPRQKYAKLGVVIAA